MAPLIIIAAIIMVLFFAYIFGGKAPKPYQNRSCMGEHWKTAFPGIPKEDIRRFLLLFVDAFSFKDNQKLKFEPNDKILDIYKSVTNNWGVDAMELEALTILFEKEYSIQLNEVWHDALTLGALFQFTLGK